MKIGLIGYGKMGKIIHKLSEAKGHQIIAIVDSKKNLSDKVIVKQVCQADICIDFSTPKVMIDNVRILSELNKSIVIGTTGWESNKEELENLIKKTQIGCMYASNFSLGIALFTKLLENAAQLISPFKQYEIGGIEIHHSKKIDAPSGTAKMIETQLERFYPEKPQFFSSLRVGNEPGKHTVIFDSFNDTITLTHEARSREGFAEGAIKSAEWLIGKTGLYTFNDFIKEMVKC